MEAMETSSNFLCLWHISQDFLPHSTEIKLFSVFSLSPGFFCLSHADFKTWSFKNFLRSILFMFAFVSNDEITEKLRKFYFLWVGRKTLCASYAAVIDDDVFFVFLVSFFGEKE